MRAASIALLLLVAGCGGPSSSLVEYEPRVHIVQPGETLSAIAFNYGLDHRDLARWNRLDDPNFIRAGQRLRLTPQPSAPAIAATPSATAPRAAAPATAGRPAAPSANPRQTPAPPPPASPPPQWHWPTAGTVASRFGAGEGVSTGIGISGVQGQAIEAAADGSVVYAGSGLIGYGQLVIIRHNDTFLTAYGYNSRLLVEQGQAVARGQRIAEMGLGPARQPRLHFEIRRNGVPVDPMPFFAAR
jgi:lipoprotein NlpD